MSDPISDLCEQIEEEYLGESQEQQQQEQVNGTITAWVLGWFGSN